MANKEQLEILKQGVRDWNEWRVRNNPVIDLTGASLSGFDLSSVDIFTHLQLFHANLTDADLDKADFGGASLVNADPWAAEIRRTRHIGDFRKWKNHDAFQKSLARLLRDLKRGD